MDNKLFLVLRHRWFYGLSCTAVAAFLLLMTYGLGAPYTDTKFSPLYPINKYTCSTGIRSSTETFQIQHVTFNDAIEVANALCSNPVISHLYGYVSISWLQRRDQINELLLQNTPPDLILASRSHIVDYLRSPISNDYTAIATITFDEFKAYFWSLQSPISMTREYFTGKTIGLVSDTTSESRYKVPLQALHKSETTPEDYNLRLYESDYELRQALLKREVDLIATIKQANRSFEGYTYHLADISPNFSYLSSEFVASPIECAILKVLEDLVESQKLYYLKRINRLTYNCDATPQ